MNPGYVIMSYYKVSNSVLLQTREMQETKEHFQDLGMVVVNENKDTIEMFDGDVRLIIENGDEMGPIMELLVPDLEMAKEDLESQGWTVLTWEGKGRRCHMANPMGALFNIVEDPQAYEDKEGGGE
jgi:hypothetical protein